MSGKFKVKSVTNLDEMKIGDIVPESDFASVTPNGNFVQLEYIEEEKEIQTQTVYPGIYTIVKTMAGLVLQKTSFTNDNILEQFVHTEEITNRVDCFFRNLHRYSEFGIEIPKRGVFLYGAPGTGKSTAISRVCKKYGKDEKTLVMLWDTIKFDASEIKDLIKSFKYEGVDKMILVIEDIGGIESDSHRMSADSALLSLLDNQEKTFTIPVCMIATTNYPENFMESLTNRSGRFDDKIEVSYPPGEARKGLLEFFSKNQASEDALKLISSKECEKFPPAHIKEIVIRAAIHEKTHVQVIKEMLNEIKKYEKGFTNRTESMGFGTYK